LQHEEQLKQTAHPTSPAEAPHRIDNGKTSQPTNQAAGLQAAAKALSEEGDSTNELSVKLDVLQKMVESLAQKSNFRNADEVPSELFEIYTRLIDADIGDDLARELICNLRQKCTPEQLHDPTGSRALLTAMVEADIQCAPPIQTEVGRRRIVALVGPTGVGKTTTIAKLAANFRLRDGVKMGLVTVDTYRIAAVEQLRTYAEIIDLPMKVVTSPQEMRRALDELSDLDLILIDTAGRSPRDELKIQELKSLLNEANVDEVHLVMSLTASVSSIKMTCELFSSVNPTSLILTKLDEAAGAGSLLSVSRDVRLPFSYLTTGQDVPEDIEPANASRIARLVLGEDRLFD
jgi:flagellar biosynthesis protein FlhF